MAICDTRLLHERRFPKGHGNYVWNVRILSLLALRVTEKAAYPVHPHHLRPRVDETGTVPSSSLLLLAPPLALLDYPVTWLDARAVESKGNNVGSVASVVTAVTAATIAVALPPRKGV